MRHLYALAMCIALALVGSLPAAAFDVITAPEDVNAVNLTGVIGVVPGENGKVQLSTAASEDGIIRRIEVLASQAGSNPNWALFALRNDSDVQLMWDIAKWGKGRFYYTEDQQALPRIFTLETQLASKASLIEQPFRPSVTAPGHEVLQEIDWKVTPPLGPGSAFTTPSRDRLAIMPPRKARDRPDSSAITCTDTGRTGRPAASAS